MEAYREECLSEAHELFKECTLPPGDPRLSQTKLLRFKISISATGEVHEHHWGTPIDSTSTTPFQPEPQLNPPSTATLELVQIPFEYQNGPGEVRMLTTNSFLTLFHSSLIDASLLPLFSTPTWDLRQGDLFHPTHSLSPTGTSLYSFFLAPPALAGSLLSWSFEPATLTTRALYLLPHDRDVPVASIHSYLRCFARYIHSPHVLSLAMVRAVLEGEKKTRSGRIYSQIADAERHTKHGHYYLVNSSSSASSTTGRECSSKAKEELKALTEHSSALAGALTRIKFGRGNLEYVYSVLLAIEEGVGGMSWRKEVREGEGGKVGWAVGEVREVVPVLRRLVRGLDTQLRFSEHRASTQMTVIFNLLTHKDAQSNLEQSKLSIQFAKSNQTLAEAMRRDSSSMKTVAIMTMVFLPGTFFSAIFAMPSIRFPERQGSVIQDGFALYWGVTVVATALVFAVWAVMTKMERIRGWWRGCMRRDAGEGTEVDSESFRFELEKK